MRVKKRGKWRQILFLCAVLFLWESVVRRDHEVDLCRMQTVCAATTLKTGTQSEPATSSAAETQIIDQLELTNLQDMVDAMLGDKTFSVTDTFHRLLSGEDVLSEESVQEFLHSLFFSGIEREKSLIVKLVLLLLFAAVFSGFAEAFDNGRSGRSVFM